jgi:uncharacterized membrane protein YbhN (UPF0104 family)
VIALQFAEMDRIDPVIVAVRPAPLRRVVPYLRYVVQLGLAAGLLAALLWRVDLTAVRDELRGASLWWLPVAFVGNLASDWFRAIRWQQFFAPMKRLPVPFLFGVAILGVATNIVLPLRAGEVLRIQVLRRRTGLHVSNIVATLLSEKLADLIAFSSFIILGIVLYQEARFLWPLALAYGAALTAGLIGARWLATRAQLTDPDMPTDNPETLLGRVRRQALYLGAGFQSLRSYRVLGLVAGTSCAAWACEATMYYACGRALGFDLPPAVYLLVVVAATIAVSVPITQAGLGVFELAIAGLLVAFDVSASEAAAFAIFSHVMLALPYFATGPIAAFALRINLRDIFFLRIDPAEQPRLQPNAESSL